jgi:hypothetical protein
MDLCMQTTRAASHVPQLHTCHPVHSTLLLDMWLADKGAQLKRGQRVRAGDMLVSTTCSCCCPSPALAHAPVADSPCIVHAVTVVPDVLAEKHSLVVDHLHLQKGMKTTPVAMQSIELLALSPTVKTLPIVLLNRTISCCREQHLVVGKDNLLGCWTHGLLPC